MNDYRLEFAKRFGDALDKKNLPERGRTILLGKQFDVSPKAVSKWLNGETIPETTKLIEICAWLGVSIEWILTGSIAVDFDSDVDLENATKVGYAPVLSWVQAGSFTDMQDVDVEECEMLPLVPGAGKHSFYLRVSGISNYPHFEEGERICIDPDWCLGDIQTGEMVVVSCDNLATFKALIVEPSGYYLKPLNPNWHEQLIKLPENCRLVGKYVGSFRPAKKFQIN